MDSTSNTLIERAQDGSNDAWQQMYDLYQPLIASWLRRYSVPQQDAADVAQEVMTIVVRELKGFEHSGRTGAFRAWLRNVTVNRIRQFWRDGRVRPLATGDSAFRSMLSELEDPNSQITSLWNQQHDDHVLVQLLNMIDREFTDRSMDIFRQHVLDQVDAETVAKNFSISVAAVYKVKSRVLRRLRQEASGLIEDSEL